MSTTTWKVMTISAFVLSVIANVFSLSDGNSIGRFRHDLERFELRLDTIAVARGVE